MSKMCFIGSASIAVATEYNKNPDADFVAISHDHAFYKHNTDLTMDGQLKFKGKPVIAYIGQPVGSNKGARSFMTAEDIKRALNKVYGASKYTREAANV